MCVIFCRPPSHPSLPKAEGAEGLKWGSGGGKGQGQAGGRARSEAKLGYPELFFLQEDQHRPEERPARHTRARLLVRMHTNTQQ